MKKPVFVDTGAFVALLSKGETHHRRARKYLDQLALEATPLVTSDYVLDEAYTLIKVRYGSERAVQFGERLRESSWVRVHWVDAGLHDRAWQIFCRTKDQDFSFTDCTSYAVMEALRLRSAFGFDRGFERFGLQLLPGRG